MVTVVLVGSLLAYLALRPGTATPSSATPSSAPASSAPPSSGPALSASQRAEDLLHKAKVAMAQTSSVEITGPLPVGGHTLTVNLHVDERAVTGTLGLGTGTAQVTIDGGVIYVRGNAAFWQSFRHGTDGLFAGTWVKVAATTAPEFKALLALLPVHDWLERVAPVGARDAELPGRTVDGVATVGIRSLAPGHADVLYVSTARPGYPALVVPATGGALKLWHWNASAPTVPQPTGKIADATRVVLKG